MTPQISVVVPTIGRADLLADCLESLARCQPRAAEVVVVDQSGGAVVAEVVGGSALADARVVPCEPRGVGHALNVGLRQVSHELVAVTHDDCTVAPDWVGAAARLSSTRPDAILTGRVLPGRPGRVVPSTKEDPAPHDYSGEIRCNVLFPNNMVLQRSLVLGFGGFDERFGFGPGAEDNDLCYRWLRAGRKLEYKPELLVWHRDWRQAEELEGLYLAYWKAQGQFYAKHLRKGDARMLRFLAGDVSAWATDGAKDLVRGKRAGPDPRRGTLRGLGTGLATGWSQFPP